MGNRISEVYQQVCGKAVEVATQCAISSVDMSYFSSANRCESEIEKLFLLGLIGNTDFATSDFGTDSLIFPSDYQRFGDLFEFYTDPGRLARMMGNHARNCIPYVTSVLAQFPVAGYRVDFAFLGLGVDHPNPSKWSRVQLIVECDGHDFHEKTKKQAMRDKKRDRALMAHGFHVMRFTGSEIWGNPLGCAKEALSFISQQHSAVEAMLDVHGGAA